MLIPIVSPLITDGLAEHIVRFLRAAESVLTLVEPVRVVCLNAPTLRRGKGYRTVGGFVYSEFRLHPPFIDVACPWKSATDRTRMLVEVRLSHELWHLEQYLSGQEPNERNWRREERAMRERILAKLHTEER